MPHLLTLLMLAFALSLDGFGIGITYGLRKMKIPWLSIVIISVCSGLVIGLSMQLGVLLSHLVSPDVASYIGAIILIGMGAWSLIQSLRASAQPGQEETVNGAPVTEEQEWDEDEQHIMKESKKTVFLLEIQKWGIVIQILKKPSAADMDDSGSISGYEAMWLGIALSLDAFGAGLGAALLGLPPLLTSVMIALFSGTFLVLGLRAGFRFASASWIRSFTALPAVMLIIMGLLKLI
ncbi:MULTISPECIES: MntP/YtaF family protein [unclassified Paenibacillus]|nr:MULTISPECIES: MntP/YtaF family protein [unclassified Paenibacillus]SDW25212.1 putative sporulation protein YtaF [Paenibacillus sp. PDC88]